MIRPTTRLLLLLGLAASTAFAQDPPRPEPPKPTWPALSSAEKDAVKLKLRQLKAEDEEQAVAAEDALTSMGAGVAPALLKRLGAREPASVEELRRILHRVVAAEYSPLIADRAGSRSALVREWSLEFLAIHHDERWRPVLAKAMKDEEPEVVFRAALGLAGMKDEAGMTVVLARCVAGEWRDHADLVQRALEPARSNQMAEWMVRRMPRTDERAVVTGLRMLRSLATKEYAGVIATFLDAEQHAIKKEAINALRAVVDGDQPLENLSVFQAIDQAKKWKERIR